MKAYGMTCVLNEFGSEKEERAHTSNFANRVVCKDDRGHPGRCGRQEREEELRDAENESTHVFDEGKGSRLTILI